MSHLPASPTAPVLAAVLLAALVHAVWNAMAHRMPDRLSAFALMGLVYTVGGAAIVAYAPAPESRSWAFLGASAVLHIAYNLLLMRSYQLGDFGQVYPLARGTSPWLVALGAAAVAGETISGLRLAGLMVVSTGLISLVLGGGSARRVHLPPVVAAVATGVMIATYTVVDGLAVRRSGSVLGYTGWLFLLQGPAMPLLAFVRSGRRLPAQLRPQLTAGLAGGLLSLLAYGLVLWAQARGALAPIAALRESSVVIGALIGAILFHEPFGRVRVVATVLVTAGIVLMNL